jgi:hypothetical protein
VVDAEDLDQLPSMVLPGLGAALEQLADGIGDPPPP